MKAFFDKIPILIVAVLFSWITLQSFRAPISYLFLVTEFSFVFVFFFVLGIKKDIGSAFRVTIRPLPAILVIIPIALLISKLTPLLPEVVTEILLLLSITLVPGYALLSIVNMKKFFTKLEGTILSFVLGFVYTSVAWLALLIFSPLTREYLLVISIIILSITTIFLSGRTDFQKGSFAQFLDVPLLVLILALFCLPLFFVYPQVVSIPGLDISQHYQWSLSFGPGMSLDAFLYLLPQSFESIFVFWGSLSSANILELLAFTNLILPITFYAMMKNWTSQLDPRLPLLATMFYCFLSDGLGWIYLIRVIPVSGGMSEQQILGVANSASYYFMTNIYQPSVLWFDPISIAFAIVLMQFVIIGKTQLRGQLLTYLIAFLIFASFLSHEPEGLILPIFFGVYCLFSKTKRFDEVLKGSAVGLILSGITFVALEYILRITIFATDTRAYLVPAFAFGSALTLFLILKLRYSESNQIFQSKMRIFASGNDANSMIRILVWIIITVYALSVILWFLGFVHSPPASEVVGIGEVPWFIFPILLGISGLLALLSLKIMIVRSEFSNGVIIFVALAVFALVSALLLSLVNSDLFNTGYWPNRFIAYLNVGCSVLAPFVIIRSYDSWLKVTAFRRAIYLAIVATILFIGIQSTFSVFAYWM